MSATNLRFHVAGKGKEDSLGKPLAPGPWSLHRAARRGGRWEEGEEEGGGEGEEEGGGEGVEKRGKRREGMKGQDGQNAESGAASGLNLVCVCVRGVCRCVPAGRHTHTYAPQSAPAPGWPQCAVPTHAGALARYG